MKPIAFLLALILLLGGLAAGGALLILGGTGDRAPTPALEPEPGAAGRGISPSEPDAVASLQAEVGRLSARLNELEDELQSLRTLALREPLAAEEEVDLAASAAGEASTAGLSPVEVEQRMREVFAAEREREVREAETARAERERAGVIARAERVARELSMSPAEEKVLVSHMLTAQDKRRVLMEGLRDSGFDRETIRAGMEDFRAWNSSELGRLFGPQLAAQLEEQGRDLMGAGFRGGGPGGEFGDFGRGSRRATAPGGGGF